MQDDDNKHQKSDQPRLKWRWWLWFLAGFVVVLVSMSVAITMYPILPSGDGVFACKLWQYYVIEIRRAFTSGNTFGPASGSGSAAITTAFQHLLFSAVGGVGMMALGWMFYKFRGR
jgi:hypothetical protein